MAIPKISDSSLSVILSALSSFKHEFISNPALVRMADAAFAEVQAYSRAVGEHAPIGCDVLDPCTFENPCPRCERLEAGRL